MQMKMELKNKNETKIVLEVSSQRQMDNEGQARNYRNTGEL